MDGWMDSNNNKHRITPLGTPRLYTQATESELVQAFTSDHP